MTAQDLWQVHYKIMLIILLHEFMKLNLNTGTMIKKSETCIITCKDGDSFFEYKNFKDDLMEYKCLACNKNYKKKLNKNLRNQFFDAY